MPTVRYWMLPAALAIASIFGAGPASAGSASVVYSFGSLPDGQNSVAGLLDLGGALYGTTNAGGTANFGTVFRIDPVTGAERVIYSFNGGKDGASPYGGVIAFDGALYGTTYKGGADGLGTVFRVDPAKGTEAVVHSFTGGNDGDLPEAGLIAVGKVLYGTTVYGGSTACRGAGCGTVFAWNPATRAERVVYSFKSGTDGENPDASLIELNGVLYGTTAYGGTAGTVFRVDPTSGAEAVVYPFKGGHDGAYPVSSLTSLHGALFGTTLYGGAGPNLGSGTVFVVNPVTGTEGVLHVFGSLGDGENPMAGLLYFNGALYGTTSADRGVYGGVVFKLDPSSGAETIVYDLGDIGAYIPEAGLIAVGGKLFGTTLGGGDPTCSFGCGTVFTAEP